MNTQNKLMDVDEVAQLVNEGKLLVLAGSENQLYQLSKGNWIGGTIPYFMDVNGGCLDNNKIFVTDFSDLAQNYKIKTYDTSTINQITKDRFKHGFSFILIPCFSEVLSQYAMKAETMADLYDSALIGWVTGIDLAEVGKSTPKIFDGKTGKISDDEIVVMHIELPLNKTAAVEIINIFTQGNGDVFMFEEEGFECKECLINGIKQNLAEYIELNNIDIRLPLVANYSGAMINISFQQINKEEKSVLFYAPLRKGIEYKLAKPVDNYIQEFKNMVPEDIDVASSCNCILNYLYSELEGEKTGLMRGPFTFGEIAYVLVNQTLVYLQIV